MAYDCQDRKKPSMRYADLFKCSSSSSSSNQSLSSWESSSLSDLSSPLGSELASSSESDDGDFAFELSRQMAEVMLQEEDDQETEKEEENPFSNEAASGHVKNAQSNLNYGHGFPPLEVYQLMNQPPTGETGTAHQKTEHRHRHNYYRQKQSYRGRNNVGQVYGSGMRAIFLGGNGPSQGSSGTGVFLPRAANDSASVKRPQTGGCSTVLIPTRVLHALELHFNRMQESRVRAQPSSSSSSSGEYRNQSCFKDEYSRKSQMEHSHELKNEFESNDNEDMRLPQEWTY